MMDLETILAATLGLVIYLVLVRLYETRRAPPGPWGLPFIGHLITLNMQNALMKVREYKQKYGKIILLRVGSYDVVVLNDYKLIQEALKRDEFLGRPDFESYKMRNGGFKNRGVLFTDGVKNWQEIRRFTLKNLREFGVGKDSMEGMLLHELNELVGILRKNVNQPISLKNSLNCSVFNSLWTILSGKRFDFEDEKFKSIIHLFTGFLDSLKLFSPANYFPWPAKYGLIAGKVWKKAEAVRDTMYADMDAVIEEHLATYQDGVIRDFIDAYVAHHKSASPDSSFYSEEGIRNLRITLMDLFAAGTETSATTLVWASMFLAKHPQVQVKLYEELDRVVGKNSVTRDDKNKLPYLEAFISEVHRKASIVPMSVYHKTQRDCEFAGYLLKKGTIVYPNLFEAHHDQEVWGDPENFRPERFLDESGTKFISKEALMPFSTGRRVCLGENLARDTLYYFVAGILQNFTLQIDPASAGVDTELPKPNFIRSPHDFKVILNIR